MVYRARWSWWSQCLSRCLTVFVMGLAMLLAGSAPAAFAQDGDLDTTFGTGGKVEFDRNNNTQFLHGMALQSDGKIVVVGNLHIGRFNADGTLDVSFGNNGLTSLTSLSGTFTAIAIYPDDSIAIAGRGAGDFVVARFLANGAPDLSFGSNGTGEVTTNLGSAIFEGARAVTIQPDGKIVAAGSTFTPQTQQDFALVRYLPDGSLDASFGTGGIVTTAMTASFDEALDVLLQPDGRIVAVGFTASGYGLARYLPDGSLDTSFGAGGRVRTNLPLIAEQAFAAVLDYDGSILVTGFDGPATNSRFNVVRYTPSGSLASNFGNNGVAGSLIRGGGHDLALQPDGKILVAGPHDNAQNGRDFGLVRFNADGTVDTTFGVNGLATADFGTLNPIEQEDEVESVIMLPDGRVLVGGYSMLGMTDWDWTIARFHAAHPVTLFLNGGAPSTSVMSAASLESSASVIAAEYHHGTLGALAGDRPRVHGRWRLVDE